MHLSPGKDLGHYEILDLIGVGGMGEVYLARDGHLGRDVALKVLPTPFLSDEGRLKRFEREARVLAALDHPTIARIHGLERVDGVTFLALEYVAGRTLAAHIGNSPLGLEEAVRVGLQVSQGLELAHECGVIHRDLKPANIRVTPTGGVKILDFGLAKPTLKAASDSSNLAELAGDVELTREGDIVGTPAYMSPEQARGRPLDRRADIWAFGCVLFECLSGKRAFAGDSVFDVLVAVVDDEPDWSALPEQVPDVLRRLLERCLHKQADRRLRDIGEARLVLDDLTRGEEGPAFEQASAEHRERTWRGAVLAAIVLAVGVLVGYGLREGAAEATTRRFEITPEGAKWGTSLQPVLSRDGTRLAWIAGEKLWVRDLSQLEARALTGTDGATHPFWSPDGEWLGFVAGDRLRKVRLTGDAHTEITRLPGTLHANGGFAWGEDGCILFATGESGLLAVRAEGGSIIDRVLLDTEAEKDFHRPALFPAGVVFPVHRLGQPVRSLEALRGERRVELFAADEQVPERPVYSTSGHLLYERGVSAPSIWAVAFSPVALALSGEPFRVALHGSRPSVSEAGLLAYERPGRSARLDLAWVDRDARTLAVELEDLEDLTFPMLAPNGRLVALADRGMGRIWVADLDRHTRTAVTPQTARLTPLYWSAESDEIGCLSEGLFALGWVDARGTDEVRIIVDAANQRQRRTAVPVPYGKWSEGGGYDLWTLPAGDGPPSELLSNPWREEMPIRSFDSQFVAYVSMKNGRDEIYATTFPEKGPELQVSRAGGLHPRWAESRLFFVSADNELMEVEVTAKPFQLSEVRSVFSGPAVGVDLLADRYDVAPDGERFLVLQDRNRGQRPPAIVVVENWLEEFEGQ